MDLTVGYFRYPAWFRYTLESGSQGSSPSTLPAGLATVSLPEGVTVGSGDDLTTVLIILSNTTDELVTETNGQVTARILDPKTGEEVGGFWVIAHARCSVPSSPQQFGRNPLVDRHDIVRPATWATPFRPEHGCLTQAFGSGSTWISDSSTTNLGGSRNGAMSLYLAAPP